VAIHRGELYSYTPVLPPRPGQSTKRLVITVDRLNDAQQSLAVGLLVNDDPGGLLTVRVGDRGWVSPVRIERLLISRLGGAALRRHRRGTRPDRRRHARRLRPVAGRSRIDTSLLAGCRQAGARLTTGTGSAT